MKAIIVHDAGREDLLLQAKYEGPLEEFGWLIPVPVLPTVEKGSMEAFYELSQLTQRLMGLKILRQNADAQAAALTLPLLRDTNSIVRNRAYALLQTVSGQNIPQEDPAKWEQWWEATKDTFQACKPTP